MANQPEPTRATCQGSTCVHTRAIDRREHGGHAPDQLYKIRVVEAESGKIVHPQALRVVWLTPEEIESEEHPGCDYTILDHVVGPNIEDILQSYFDDDSQVDWD